MPNGGRCELVFRVFGLSQEDSARVHAVLQTELARHRFPLWNKSSQGSPISEFAWYSGQLWDKLDNCGTSADLPIDGKGFRCFAGATHFRRFSISSSSKASLTFVEIPWVLINFSTSCVDSTLGRWRNFKCSSSFLVSIAKLTLLAHSLLVSFKTDITTNKS